MSIPERIFRISKAYINQVRDRIDSELSDAQRELDDAHPDGPSGVLPGESDTDAMMRRAQEKIASARRELDSQLEKQRAAGGAVPTPPTEAEALSNPAIVSRLPRETAPTAASIAARTEDPNAADYRVLGVPVGSDLEAVTTAYKRLAERSDPKQAPAESQEHKDLQRLYDKFTASYESLRRRLDPTSNRFGKLEFE